MNNNSLVLNLKDNEKNLSGKEFNWSWFGLNNTKEKNAALGALKELDKQIKVNMESADYATKNNKSYSDTMRGMSADTKKLAKDMTRGNITFGQATGSINKMSLSSKAAAVGMQALSIAMNVGIMLAVSATIKIILDINLLTSYNDNKLVGGVKIKTVAVRVSEEVHQKLKIKVLQQQTSIQELLEKFIISYIETLEETQN